MEPSGLVLRGLAPAVVDAWILGVPEFKYGEALGAWVRLREGARTDCGGVKKTLHR